MSTLQATAEVAGHPATATSRRNVFTSSLGALYRTVMTPITFVSFLVSLVVIDHYYTSMRVHNNSECPSRLPSWLHGIVYRPTPYQYVAVKDTNATQAAANEGGRTKTWYLHSKQKKLMRMEAEDAFEIRSAVLAVMAVMLALGSWGTWVIASWMIRRAVGHLAAEG